MSEQRVQTQIRLFLLPVFLKCMGIPPSFSPMFTKGDNFRDFLFAYLEDDVFPKWRLLLKERICSKGGKVFPLRADLFIWEATMKITELLPLKVYLFTLKSKMSQFLEFYGS